MEKIFIELETKKNTSNILNKVNELNKFINFITFFDYYLNLLIYLAPNLKYKKKPSSNNNTE